MQNKIHKPAAWQQVTEDSVNTPALNLVQLIASQTCLTHSAILHCTDGQCDKADDDKMQMLQQSLMYI